MPRKLATCIMFAFLIALELPAFWCSGCIGFPLPSQSPSRQPSPTLELDPAIEFKMRTDFLRFLRDNVPAEPDYWKLDEIAIQRYIGTYSGCVVAFMQCKWPYNELQRVEYIGSCTVVFWSSQEAYVYYNSTFYTIKEAFDARIITQNDVCAIRSIFAP